MDANDLIELAIRPLEWKASRPKDNNFIGDYLELSQADLFEYRYEVTPDVAFDAFLMAVQIGEQMLADKWGGLNSEAVPLWSEFVQRYGRIENYFSEYRDPDTFSSVIQFHFAAKCNQLSALIGQFRYEDIKKMSIIVDDRVTFLRGTAWFDPWVDISQYNGKWIKSMWGSIARDWMKKTFAFFFGRPFIGLYKDKLMLELPGLQSAVWLAFWHNVYPQLHKKYCMSCGRPMITDNPRVKVCDDCKQEKVRKKDREKKWRKRHPVNVISDDSVFQ